MAYKMKNNKKTFNFGNKGNFDFTKTTDYSPETIQKRRAKKLGEKEGPKSYSEADAEYEKRDNP